MNETLTLPRINQNYLVREALYQETEIGTASKHSFQTPGTPWPIRILRTISLTADSMVVEEQTFGREGFDDHAHLNQRMHEYTKHLRSRYPLAPIYSEFASRTLFNEQGEDFRDAGIQDAAVLPLYFGAARLLNEVRGQNYSVYIDESTTDIPSSKACLLLKKGPGETSWDRYDTILEAAKQSFVAAAYEPGRLGVAHAAAVHSMIETVQRLG